GAVPVRIPPDGFSRGCGGHRPGVLPGIAAFRLPLRCDESANPNLVVRSRSQSSIEAVSSDRNSTLAVARGRVVAGARNSLGRTGAAGHAARGADPVALRADAAG